MNQWLIRTSGWMSSPSSCPKDVRKTPKKLAFASPDVRQTGSTGIFLVQKLSCDSQRDERLSVASRSAPDVNYIVAAPDPISSRWSAAGWKRFRINNGLFKNCPSRLRWKSLSTSNRLAMTSMLVNQQSPNNLTILMAFGAWITLHQLSCRKTSRRRSACKHHG